VYGESEGLLGGKYGKDPVMKIWLEIIEIERCSRPKIR